MNRVFLSIFLWLALVGQLSPWTHGAATTSGQGGGPNARILNVFSPAYGTPQNQRTLDRPAASTADYYHMDGLYWMRPWDLTDADCGSTGASIAASKGRYFWTATADHPNSLNGWTDAQDIMGGFSSDPEVPPSVLYSLLRFNNLTTDVPNTPNTYSLYQAAFLVCNPDDASFPFYLYTEGTDIGGPNALLEHQEGGAKSGDLVSWTLLGVTHAKTTINTFTSFQRVIRTGTNTWKSFGFGPPGSALLNLRTSVYTATSGAGPFTYGSTGAGVSGGWAAGTAVTIAGQTYDVTTFGTGVGVQASFVPIDANYNYLGSPAVIPISNTYSQLYPGPTWVQACSSYQEGGVVHVFCTHGLPQAVNGDNLTQGGYYQGTCGGAPGAVCPSPWPGGGLWEQYLDVYSYIYDATAAANAAPVGLTGYCAGNVVTLNWQDALPDKNYRIYKGSAAGSEPVLVATIVGVTVNDASPTANAQDWYKVVKLNSGVEQGSREISVYCSANSRLTNAHVNRVINDGGNSAHIDITKLEAAVQWLVSNGENYHLEHWAAARWGDKESLGQVVKVYDLGTTILPRGGDLTFCSNQSPCTGTSNTTYSATGLNSTTPAWVNGSTSSFGYFGGGRINNIRRKTQITVGAVYQGSASAALIATGEFGGMSLSVGSGNVTMSLTDTSTTKTATAVLAGSTAKIISGSFDQTNLVAWSEGVGGTPVTGLNGNANLALNTTLKGQISANGGGVLYFLQSGSTDAKISSIGTPYPLIFDNAQAASTISDLILFDNALSSGQEASLFGASGLIRGWVGP